MSPWDVLVWIIVIFLAVVFFIIAVALVVSLVRALRNPRGRAQQIHLMDRDIRREQ